MLQEENLKLKNFILSKVQDKAKTSQIIHEEKMKPTELFLSQIRDVHDNRVVNAKTLRFLKGLRKNLPTKEEQEAYEEERQEQAAAKKAAAATEAAAAAAASSQDNIIDEKDDFDYDAAFDPLLIMA